MLNRSALNVPTARNHLLASHAFPKAKWCSVVLSANGPRFLRANESCYICWHLFVALPLTLQEKALSVPVIERKLFYRASLWKKEASGLYALVCWSSSILTSPLIFCIFSHRPMVTRAIDVVFLFAVLICVGVSVQSSFYILFLCTCWAIRNFEYIFFCQEGVT